MKWAFVYLIIAAIGTLIWVVRFAIRENKLDKTRGIYDYPDWMAEQKRRREYLDKMDINKMPAETKKGRTHD